MVGQREMKVEVERGRQVDVSANVGRELQRLYVYKDTLTTYRRYSLWKAREKGKWKWRVGRQVDVSALVGRELQRLYKDTLATYRRYTLGLAREKEKWKWKEGDR